MAYPVVLITVSICLTYWWLPGWLGSTVSLVKYQLRTSLLFPVLFWFFQYQNHKHFDSLEQSITLTKVHKASQREARLLKRLHGEGERTSTKCQWQLAQVHQDEPQAGQMHGSGVCWNYSSDCTRQNKPQSRWGKVIWAPAGQENKWRSQDTALMQTLKKSPHRLGAWHGTKRPRAFAAARAVPQSPRSISRFPKSGTDTHGLDSRPAPVPLPTGTAGNLSFPRPLVQVEQRLHFILLFPWYH